MKQASTNTNMNLEENLVNDYKRAYYAKCKLAEIEIRFENLKEMAEACEKVFTETEMEEIENCLPLGWAFGDRYSVAQWVGPEKYC